MISVPGVKEAKIRMECTPEKSFVFGRDEMTSCDLIIGKIVHFHIEEILIENGRIDPIGLAAVSRLAGDGIAKIGANFTLKRPR